MAKARSLQDLFLHLLKDMYYAEKQILKALPRMAKKADSNDLRMAFEHHLRETEGQVAPWSGFLSATRRPLANVALRSRASSKKARKT